MSNLQDGGLVEKSHMKGRLGVGGLSDEEAAQTFPGEEAWVCGL